MLQDVLKSTLIILASIICAVTLTLAPFQFANAATIEKLEIKLDTLKDTAKSWEKQLDRLKQEYKLLKADSFEKALKNLKDDNKRLEKHIERVNNIKINKQAAIYELENDINDVKETIVQERLETSKVIASRLSALNEKHNSITYVDPTWETITVGESPLRDTNLTSFKRIPIHLSGSLAILGSPEHYGTFEIRAERTLDKIPSISLSDEHGVQQDVLTNRNWVDLCERPTPRDPCSGEGFLAYANNIYELEPGTYNWKVINKYRNGTSQTLTGTVKVTGIPPLYYNNSIAQPYEEFTSQQQQQQQQQQEIQNRKEIKRELKSKIESFTAKIDRLEEKYILLEKRVLDLRENASSKYIKLLDKNELLRKNLQKLQLDKNNNKTVMEILQQDLFNIEQILAGERIENAQFILDNLDAMNQANTDVMYTDTLKHKTWVQISLNHDGKSITTTDDKNNFEIFAHDMVPIYDTGARPIFGFAKHIGQLEMSGVASVFKVYDSYGIQQFGEDIGSDIYTCTQYALNGTCIVSSYQEIVNEVFFLWPDFYTWKLINKKSNQSWNGTIQVTEAPPSYFRGFD